MRILLVEDNEDDAYLATYMLGRRGHEAFLATSLKQAIKMCTDGEYDCALVDLMLPDGQGEEVIRSIRSEFPALPMVILSGHIADEILSIAVDLGIQDYVGKDALTGLILHHAVLTAVERSHGN